MNILLIMSVVGSQGCAVLIGAAAGAGGMAYFRGTLEKNFDKPLKKVHKTTLNALKSIDVFITRDDLNRDSAKIKGVFPDEKKVTVNIEGLTERATRIKIRVGIFGDETKSIMILNTIQKRL